MFYRLPAIILLVMVSGCSWLAGGSAVDAATVVYTRGSSQSTTSARIPVDAESLYSGFSRILDEETDIEIVSRKDSAMMIEVTGDFGEITAQVTPLGSRESLLYIWADATGTGRLGGEVANAAVQRICDELGVSYELIEY